jgi:hypothetical protein
VSRRAGPRLSRGQGASFGAREADARSEAALREELLAEMECDVADSLTTRKAWRRLEELRYGGIGEAPGGWSPENWEALEWLRHEPWSFFF